MLLFLPDSFTSLRNVARAAQHRLPAVYAFRDFTAIGGLMSDGTDADTRSGVWPPMSIAS
jgi:hypothetical protein